MVTWLFFVGDFGHGGENSFFDEVGFFSGFLIRTCGARYLIFRRGGILLGRLWVGMTVER